MACGNNHVSREVLQSPARPLGHPDDASRAAGSAAAGSPGGREPAATRHLLEAATRGLHQAERRIQSATTATGVASGLREATAAVAQARRTGDRARTAELERKLAQVVRTSKARASAIEADERMRGILARAVLDAQNDRLAPWNLGTSLLVKAGSVLDTVGDVAHLAEETVSIATIIASAGSGPVPTSPLVSSPTDSTISRSADTPKRRPRRTSTACRTNGCPRPSTTGQALRGTS